MFCFYVFSKSEQPLLSAHLSLFPGHVSNLKNTQEGSFQTPYAGKEENESLPLHHFTAAVKLLLQAEAPCQI